MKKHFARKSLQKNSFVNDNAFTGFKKPTMLEAAKEMLCLEHLSEEAFLGAQGVLLLNGIL